MGKHQELYRAIAEQLDGPHIQIYLEYLVAVFNAPSERGFYKRSSELGLADEKPNGKGANGVEEEEESEDDEAEIDEERRQNKWNRARMVQIFAVNQYVSSVSVFKVSGLALR